MQGEEWRDITEEVLALKGELKLLEVVKDDKVSLEDCMHAQEINDDKMDPKHDIGHQHTISYMMKEAMIKHPKELSFEELAQVFANVFQLQASMLGGEPFFSTIYQFAYLYDPTLTSQHFLLKPLIESINCMGAYLYEVIKAACSFKEDDINVSSFSFDERHLHHDQVIQLLLQAEKELENQGKKDKNNEHIKSLIAMLRVRRFIHLLMKTLDLKYDNKNFNKITSDIQSAKKRFTALEDRGLEYKELHPQTFNKSLAKTLRSHFGPKQSKIPSFSEALAVFRNTFTQLEVILPLPLKISDYKNRLEIIDSLPYNAWSKSYIKSNLFASEDYLMNTIKTEEALIEQIEDWVHLKENVKQTQKFIQLIKNAAPAISETLYRMSCNKMRWFWECSKIYEDYNILIHMANDLDATVTVPHRQIYICSWFYYYGLNLMIKQLLTGFQINLYQSNQLKYVLYVLENLLSMFDRNSHVHLRKIDKIFTANFFEGNFNKKLKKKMTENGRKMFADIHFKKGLQLYIKSLFQIVTILQLRKLVENPFQSSEEMRVKQRFRIFKNVVFTKIMEYQEYRKVVEDKEKQEKQTLETALQHLKEAKNIFKLYTDQIQEHDSYLRQKEEAEVLMKMSVKLSVIVMSLKMGAKKKYTIKCDQKYPEVYVQ